MELPLPTQARLEAAIERLRHDPESLDLFALLRYIEACTGDMARLGHSRTPREDPVRLSQHPSTAFAPAAVHSLEPRGRRAAPTVRILSLGLFGPNGPLPLHLTEYVRERLRNHDDSTLAAFADIFHHRLLSLFYRAWADAQAIVQLDRPGDDRFSFHAGALSGMASESMRNRSTVEDEARLFASGHFVRLTRNAEGLSRTLAHYFGLPVRVQEFIHSWLAIRADQRTRLSDENSNNQLGHGAIAGAHVPDVQSRFRLQLGPMPLAAYQRLLPGAGDNIRLRDWVRHYAGVEFLWDAVLLLHAEAVPQTRLGGPQRLGWTSWIGQRSTRAPAADLRLSPERDCERFATA